MMPSTLVNFHIFECKFDKDYNMEHIYAHSILQDCFTKGGLAEVYANSDYNLVRYY